MKFRCRIFGHDEWTHLAAPSPLYLGPRMIVLVTRCHRCEYRDVLEVPDRMRWTVLPEDR